jgi:hypothetical protein
MRERRLVVTHTLHDCDLVLVVQLLDAAHRLVPPELRVDLEQVAFLDADGRPMLVVHRVAVRHDRVQPVVTSEPLEDHEDLARLRRGGFQAGAVQDKWDGSKAAQEAKAEAAGADPDHVAPRDAAVGQSTPGCHTLCLRERIPLGMDKDTLSEGRAQGRVAWRLSGDRSSSVRRTIRASQLRRSRRSSDVECPTEITVAHASAIVGTARSRDRS